MKQVWQALCSFGSALLVLISDLRYLLTADKITTWLNNRAEALKEFRDFKNSKLTEQEMARYPDLSKYRLEQVPEIVKVIYKAKNHYQTKYAKVPNLVTLPDSYFDEWCTAAEHFDFAITEGIFGVRVSFGPLEDITPSVSKTG